MQVIAGHERPIGSLFKVESCLTRYRAADVKLWEPNEGDDGLVRIIKKEEFANSYIVEPVAVPAEVQTKVGWYTTTETIPGYTEQEKCEVSK